ncbi:hypothetical protein G7Z17_g7233 [Cylindrodendrum hubeiense]|uniref:Condensation domain-containing protein n=1 Tax=Cylindrodendrum hubeiense TaxID=595255 RepID=A0A9P5LA38_9HYPO|nr:hypothetical protein G7Z17_g7233 [Cylindrodendrum hubeiense]
MTHVVVTFKAFVTEMDNTGLDGQASRRPELDRLRNQSTLFQSLRNLEYEAGSRWEQQWQLLSGIQTQHKGRTSAFGSAVTRPELYVLLISNLAAAEVKAIQFLGEVASYAADIDLGTFLRTGTINSLWKNINGSPNYTNGVNGNEGGRQRPSPVTTKAAGDSSRLGTHPLDLALEKTHIDTRDVLRTAPISSVQDFFLQLGLRGDISLINYVFEVEGPDLKRGLRHLTRLLETKNPIFRTTIVDLGEQEFAQVLLSKSTTSWSYPSELKPYLEGIMAQKFQLGTSAVQYALILGDATHEGRSFFAICMHHTHCDAFSRFLIGKEILQILKSPSDYARTENIERPWFGDFVTHLHTTALDEDPSRSWDDYLRGANMANIYPLEQAVVDGEFDGAVMDTIPVLLARGKTNSGATKNPTQVILAAWTMALAKLSGLCDITFGLCRHGRSSNSFADLRRIMGPLVNGVPFRISVQSGEEPAAALLQRVQDELTTTGEWEQKFAPGVFPSADGRQWVQSFVNLRSELHGMRDGCLSGNVGTDITKILPRPDLEMYDMKGHWAALLSITQQRDNFQVSMFYQSVLLDQHRAVSLFRGFRGFIDALSTTDGRSVGDFLA